MLLFFFAWQNPSSFIIFIFLNPKIDTLGLGGFFFGVVAVFMIWGLGLIGVFAEINDVINLWSVLLLLDEINDIKKGDQNFCD